MEYLNSEDVTQLLRSLIERTIDGRVTWEPADQEFEFMTRGKKFVYFIASGDKDDLPPHIFEIWDANPLAGNPQAEKLQVVVTSEFSTQNDLLRTLYTEAKRRGLKTDEIAREILSDFD